MKDARVELRNLSDAELQSVIDDIAKTIVVRTYDSNGNSSDDRRDSTDKEYQMLRCIVYSAIYTFTHDLKADIQTIVDMAEITLMKFTETLPQFNEWSKEHCNCYDTIYTPLMKIFGVWG